jgi:hypothetical protein
MQSISHQLLIINLTAPRTQTKQKLTLEERAIPLPPTPVLRVAAACASAVMSLGPRTGGECGGCSLIQINYRVVSKRLGFFFKIASFDLALHFFWLCCVYDIKHK